MSVLSIKGTRRLFDIVCKLKDGPNYKFIGLLVFENFSKMFFIVSATMDLVTSRALCSVVFEAIFLMQSYLIVQRYAHT